MPRADRRPAPPAQRRRSLWRALLPVAVLALLVLAMLAGCAARTQPMGPAVQAPDLTGEALIAADGYGMPLRVWRPDGPARAAMVALHGFNDYSRAFDEAGQAWAAAGIATYAYDQRGFGATREPGIWPGTGTLVADARAAVDLVRARHPGLPVYLLGESMGGAVAIAALGSDDPPPVAGAILVAPAVWGRADMGAVERLGLWWARHVTPGLTVTGRGLDITPSDNRAMLQRMSRDPLVIKATRLDTLSGLVDLMDHAIAETADLAVPVLVLYGENEEVLPEASIDRLIRRLPAVPRTVAFYPSGYHMLLRDRQAALVVRDIAAWIGDQYARLPSGADRDDTPDRLAAR